MTSTAPPYRVLAALSQSDAAKDGVPRAFVPRSREAITGTQPKLCARCVGVIVVRFAPG